VLRNILKVIVSLFWVIILPLFYMHSFAGAPDFIKKLLSFVHEMKGIPPYYILAVAVYLIPNVLAAFLFLFPMLRRWIENSDWHIIRLLLWWSQVLCAILPNLLPYLIISLRNHGLNYFICMMLPMYLFTL
jgi:callose synthase